MKSKAPSLFVAVCVVFLSAAVVAAAADFALQPAISPHGTHIDILMNDGGGMLKNRPEFLGEDAEIGRMLFSDGEEGAMLLLALDRDSERLYLDLNRNGDLSDDPKGVYMEFEGNSWGHKFQGIDVPIEYPDGEICYTMDLTFWSDTGYGESKTGWKGTLSLAGKDWHFEICDDLDGEIDGGDRIILYAKDNESAAARAVLKATDTLALDGRVYGLNLDLDPASGNALLSVEEKTLPLGELQIEGEKISRLVLSGDCTVICDHPDAVLAVPVGIYNSACVLIDAGGEEDYFISRPDGIEVAADGSAELPAGGPLDNALDVTRSGGLLRMEYSLRGVGGEEYTRSACASDPGPQYSVHQKGKQVAAGKFEYG